MLIAEHTVEIHAPVEKVWDKLKQVDSWHEWDASILNTQFNQEFVNESTGRLRPDGGPETAFTLRNVVENQTFDVHSNLPLWNRLIVAHELEDLDGGASTRLTHTIEISGCCSLVFATIIGRSLRNALPTAMENLKGTVEQDTVDRS